MGIENGEEGWRARTRAIFLDSDLNTKNTDSDSNETDSTTIFFHTLIFKALLYWHIKDSDTRKS